LAIWLLSVQKTNITLKGYILQRAAETDKKQKDQEGEEKRKRQG